MQYLNLVHSGPKSNSIDVAMLYRKNTEIMIKKIVFIITAIFSMSSWAQEVPSDWTFVTLRTAHFDIIVNAEQQDLGRFYANKAEAAFQDLAPFWTDLPPRTTIVLADNTDTTNGYATRIPYQHIFIYPVLPGPQDSLSDSGDWVYELVAHEMTHILTFEAVSGVMEPLQNIFGTVLSPNLLLPRWWKEGVAVQMETSLSNGGRLRSPYQDSIIRAFAIDGTLSQFDLPQVNEVLPDWPKGLRPYLFGSLFWSEAVAEKGTGIIDKLHQAHGGRVPYFVEQPAVDFLGTSYDYFYQRALLETENRAREQLTFLAGTNPIEGRPLHIQAMSSQNPRLSPDGRYLAVITVDHKNQRLLSLFSRNPKTSHFEDPLPFHQTSLEKTESIKPSEDAPAAGSITRAEWFPDGEKIVYDRTDRVSRLRSTSDLWIYDLKKEKSEKLTKGLRAREPFVPQHGKWILFVGLDGGRTWLGRYHLESKTSEKLWQSNWQERISYPIELPSGQMIFSIRDGAGQEFLYMLSPGETTPHQILNQFHQAKFPQWRNDRLIFVSAQNGIYNAYETDDKLESVTPISHTRTGVFVSDRDAIEGGYYLTSMGSKGLEIVYIPDEGRHRGEDLPFVEPIFADRYPPAKSLERLADVPVETLPYQPGPYLKPHYWVPVLGFSSFNGSALLQASTSSFDPLKYHFYNLSASWDFGISKGSFSGTYQNNQMNWPILLQAIESHSYFVSIDHPLTQKLASVAVQPDLFSWDRHLISQVQWIWQQTDVLNNSWKRTGPSWTLSYSNVSMDGDMISPDDSWFGYVGSTHSLKANEQLSYNQYFTGGGIYFSKWLPERHAIMARTSLLETPEKIPSTLGATSSDFFYTQDPQGPSYVLRGYQVGQFYGRKMRSANFEYRFPGADLRRGSGTDPYYLIRWHGAVFIDGMSLDGVSYLPKTQIFQRTRLSQFYWSAGAEARLETTIGYMIPLNLIAGYAFPGPSEASPGAGFLFGLQIGTTF